MECNSCEFDVNFIPEQTVSAAREQQTVHIV